MNSTIKQMSRPAKEQQLPKGLPPEAKKFAKQMGLDLKGLEAEVNSSEHNAINVTDCGLCTLLPRLKICAVADLLIC